MLILTLNWDRFMKWGILLNEFLASHINGEANAPEENLNDFVNI